MKTDVTTPQGIFGMPQHLTVPIYQRPYVWNEDEQWGPLWSDVRRIAEHRLGHADSHATHFLGAVVTQLADSAPVGVQEFNIVDGQQRLTTLQLLLDATAAQLHARGLFALEGQLHFLTHNADMFVGGSGPTLKLRHTNRDREAFDEVMGAEAPIDHGRLQHGDSLITLAHHFFSGQVAHWLDEGPQPAELKAAALSVALQSALQLVVIRLEADEDSQEIFETLNARGTPLTAADLIKNFVFQRLRAEGEDGHKLYRETWPFETKFWEEEVSVGRVTTTRSALFLGQWLISRVGQEVSPRSTFTRFKFYVEHEATETMADLLGQIARQARDYRALVERSNDKYAELDRLALHVYRTSVLQTEISRPIVLWMTEPGNPYSPPQRDAVIEAVESWLMRRRLLRLQSSDQGRIAAALVAVGRRGDPAEVVQVVESHLRGQQFASTYWPGDDELRSSLNTVPFYRRFAPAMQRLVLQAVEDWYRGYGGSRHSKTGIRVHRDKQQVEHILPRSWQTNWSVEGHAAAADREDHVQRLGNLTLLTGALNGAVSNAPWQGTTGKRAALQKHDVLLMNRRVLELGESEWNERLIDLRTSELIEAILDTWRVPAGHLGEVKDRSARRSKATVNYADLVAAGLLPVGTVLRAADPKWNGASCVVLAGGQVEKEGQAFGSPAAAARNVRGGSVNAWWFWQTPDGELLNVLRDRYLEQIG